MFKTGLGRKIAAAAVNSVSHKSAVWLAGLRHDAPEVGKKIWGRHILATAKVDPDAAYAAYRNATLYEYLLGGIFSEGRLISMSALELRRLVCAVMEVEPKTVLEIGRLKGGSLMAIHYANRLTRECKYLSVDNHSKYNREINPLDENDARLRDYFERTGSGEFVLSTESSAQARERNREKAFDFILIDGSHKYFDIVRDCEWLYQLRDRGMAAFHDVHEKHPGVMKAVMEFFGHGRTANEWRDKSGVRYKIISHDDSMLVVQSMGMDWEAGEERRYAGKHP